MKKVYVMIGNYGSGKTELALNFAFRAAERGERTELLDQFLSEGHDPKFIGKPLAIDTYMQRDWDSWVKGL